MELFIVEYREKYKVKQDEKDDLVIVESHVAHITQDEDEAHNFPKGNLSYGPDNMRKSWWWAITKLHDDEYFVIYNSEGELQEYENYEPTHDILTLLSFYRASHDLWKEIANGCREHSGYRVIQSPRSNCAKCAHLWELKTTLKEMQEDFLE